MENDIELEVEEGNDLIAEYLGFERKSYGHGDSFWVDDKHKLPVGELLFHDDWNWLMIVIKKMSSIDQYYKAGVAITIADYNYEIFDVWKSIVNHIKLYNGRKDN